VFQRLGLPLGKYFPGHRLSELLMSPRNFCLAEKMGGAIPFDGRSFAGGAGGAACLPALNFRTPDGISDSWGN
jgi:hypothetical protein